MRISIQQNIKLYIHFLWVVHYILRKKDCVSTIHFNTSFCFQYNLSHFYLSTIFLKISSWTKYTHLCGWLIANWRCAIKSRKKKCFTTTTGLWLQRIVRCVEFLFWSIFMIMRIKYFISLRSMLKRLVSKDRLIHVEQISSEWLHTMNMTWIET